MLFDRGVLKFVEDAIRAEIVYRQINSLNYGGEYMRENGTICPFGVFFTCFIASLADLTTEKKEPFVLLAFFPRFYSIFRVKIGHSP